MEKFISLILIAFTLVATNLSARTFSTVNLTVEEKQWIATHMVRVGVEQWDPVVFSNDGSDIDGIAGDILKQIIGITGLKTKVVNALWGTLLADFRDKKLDLLPATYFTEERAKFGLYSTSYFKMKGYLFILEDNDSIKSMHDLKGKKLAIVGDYGTIDKIQEKFPEIELVFTDNLDNAINQTLNGTVDAFYEGKVPAEKKMSERSVTGLKGIAQSSFKAPRLHLFSNSDEPLLQSILQKGLDAISRQEKSQIIRSWVLEERQKNVLSFTEQEQHWINNNRVTVGVEDWFPIIFSNNGSDIDGISGDLLKRIMRLTGLKIHVVTDKWSTLLNDFKDKKIDLLPDAFYSEERTRYGFYSAA